MDLWAFSTSPHGLSLSSEQFWRLTPGAFAALRRQWQYGQDRIAIPLAWIRADLHNAWMHQQGKPAYTAEDFLPGRKKKPVQSTWQSDMQVFAMVAEAKGAIKPRAEEKERALAEWMERAKRKRQELGLCA